MGLSERTRLQQVEEGLSKPNDVEDFNEEADLDGLFKLLAISHPRSSLGLVLLLP
jgi:hypothetical protein